MKPATFFACVFLPFGLGHFMSVLLRMVGGVTAPAMLARYGLDQAQLGVLSGAYFLGFALVQLPVGQALDRYGPRRVQATLLPLAAFACWGFGHASDFTGLLLARLLLGASLGACFMAAVKAAATWGACARLPSTGGWLISAGGLGGAAATLPVQWLLDAAGWHGLFNWLALALALVAALIAVATPAPVCPPARRQRWAEGARQVWSNREVRRIAGLLAVPHMAYFGLQGLWIGRWLHAGGLQEIEVAWQLYLCMVGAVFGAIGAGLLVERAERRGVAALDVAAAGLALFILVQLAMAFGWPPSLAGLAVLFSVAGAVAGLEYTLVARAVPKDLAGRATTCLNLLVFSGAFAVQALSGYLAQLSFAAVFVVVAMAQCGGLLVYVAGRRKAASSACASLATSVDSSASLIVKGGASST
jgi:MFS family permease